MYNIVTNKCTMYIVYLRTKAYLQYLLKKLTYQERKIYYRYQIENALFDIVFSVNSEITSLSCNKTVKVRLNQYLSDGIFFV